jgi:hypothetical protein
VNQIRGPLTALRPLVTIHDRTFLFGYGLGLGANTLLLAYLTSIHQHTVQSRIVVRHVPKSAVGSGSDWGLDALA